MSSDEHGVPDYELAERVVASTPAQLKALADPLRSALLDLVLERAANVNELAQAVGRPPSSVAHHVGVLVDAGLLRVVRTRKVKAIEERFYGRTGRTIAISPTDQSAGLAATNLLAEGAAEAGPAAERDDLRCTLRHVRIPAETAVVFWEQVLQLADDFTRLPHSGDVVFGFAAGLYPTDQPTLPDPEETDDD